MISAAALGGGWIRHNTASVAASCCERTYDHLPTAASKRWLLSCIDGGHLKCVEVEVLSQDGVLTAYAVDAMCERNSPTVDPGTLQDAVNHAYIGMAGRSCSTNRSPPNGPGGYQVREMSCILTNNQGHAEGSQGLQLKLPIVASMPAQLARGKGNN